MSRGGDGCYEAHALCRQLEPALAGFLWGTIQNMPQSYPNRGFIHQVPRVGAISMQIGSQCGINSIYTLGIILGLRIVRWD